MSDTRNHTPRDQLVSVLAEHSETWQSDGDYGEHTWIECSCDQDDDHDDSEGWRTGYVKHLADVLEPVIAAVRAAAVAETTAAIETVLRDDPVFGDLGGAISAAVEGLPASLPGSGPPVTVERCYATGFAAPVIAAVSTRLRAALSGGRTALNTTLAQARAELREQIARGIEDSRDRNQGNPAALAYLTHAAAIARHGRVEGADQ